MSDASHRKRQRTRKITEAVRRSIINEIEPPQGKLINIKILRASIDNSSMKSENSKDNSEVSEE